MKILMIGASGMLGKPVTRALQKAGFSLRLLARDPSKMEALYPGTEIVKGDVLDKASLLPAMQGMDAMYCNLSVLSSSKETDPQPEREGVDGILAAAKETGIQRMAYLSSLVHRYEGMNGFSWWAFRVKASAVKKIQESGIPYTIFYPSTFMETYPFQMLQGRKVAALGKSVVPMWFIAGEDYGKQVAASFQKLTHENRDYAIQGPEAFVFTEANRIFIENYKKAKLGIMRVPVPLVKLIGNFSQKYDYLWRICEALNKYPENFESELAWGELGKPEVTLKEYAASL